MGITPTPDANLEFMRWVSTITNDELFLYSEEKDIEDELDSDLIMELRKPKISLDDVLDKIYIGGVASLTEKEETESSKMLQILPPKKNRLLQKNEKLLLRFTPRLENYLLPGIGLS